jgi:hypothetical protein
MPKQAADKQNIVVKSEEKHGGRKGKHPTKRSPRRRNTKTVQKQHQKDNPQRVRTRTFLQSKLKNPLARAPN